MDQTFESMQDRVRRALTRYPIASLTMLRGAVQSNHDKVHPATLALVDSGEVVRVPAVPFTRQAERVYLARYREHLMPFLLDEAGRDYSRPFRYDGDPYAREHAEHLGRIVEALSLYPVLPRWALCLVLSSNWDWIERDLAWLKSRGIVGEYLPGDGDRRRVPRYYLTQHARYLGVFLGGEGQKEAVLQGA